MRSFIVMRSFIAILAFTCAVSGCAEQESPEAPHAAESVVEEVSGTFLASIDVEPGHTIRFYEVQPGLVVASESGKLATQPSLLPEREIGSFVDLFQTLAPERTVPPALVAAEARRTALQDEVKKWPAPEAAQWKGGAADSFFTDGEQEWFRETQCPGSVKCIQGWDWIDSGNDHATNWKTTALVGTDGSATARLVANYWKCDQVLVDPETGAYVWFCRWVPFHERTIAPGYYTWISGHGGPFYFNGALSGANGQVSMAIHVW